LNHLSEFPDYVEDDPEIYAFENNLDALPPMPAIANFPPDTGNTVQPVEIRKNFADVWIWQSIGRRWVTGN